jgi:hypothetical protein
MKNISIIIIAISLLLISCKYDNFDEPTSVITGKVVYQGKTLSFRSNALFLQLWQPGFGLYTSVSVAVNQNGTFNALMFDGQYRLINASGTTQPWVLRTDTVKFELAGTASVDYEVTPYFLISDEVYTTIDTSVVATCKIAKIATTATLSNATLYISRTSMCDENYKESSLQILPAAMPDLNNVSIKAGITKRVRDQGYCYVRVGVKASQASERLYTQVQKITF